MSLDSHQEATDPASGAAAPALDSPGGSVKAAMGDQPSSQGGGAVAVGHHQTISRPTQ